MNEYDRNRQFDETQPIPQGQEPAEHTHRYGDAGDSRQDT